MNANQSRDEIGMRDYWDRAWEKAGVVEGLSLQGNVIEETKWAYLKEDMGALTGHAVEVGCGSGHMGSLLAQDGLSVTMLDYSPSALGCAMKSFTRLSGRERKSFVAGDANRLPIADGSVDLVLSCGLLEHFADPLPVVTEMSRILRPGGLFYADICPRKFALVRLVERCRGDAEGWYEGAMRIGDIRSMIARSGLRLIRVFPAGVLPPRSVPGTGRFAWMAATERFAVNGLRRFWTCMDGTMLAEWLGLYYYVSARKPDQ